MCQVKGIWRSPGTRNGSNLTLWRLGSETGGSSRVMEEREARAARVEKEESTAQQHMLEALASAQSHCVQWEPSTTRADFPDVSLHLGHAQAMQAVAAMHSAAPISICLGVTTPPAHSFSADLLWGRDATRLRCEQMKERQQVHWSEALALEVLGRLFAHAGLQLLAGEAAVDDDADFVCTLGGKPLGVDVTRALGAYDKAPTAAAQPHVPL